MLAEAFVATRHSSFNAKTSPSSDKAAAAAAAELISWQQPRPLPSFLRGSLLPPSDLLPQRTLKESRSVVRPFATSSSTPTNFTSTLTATVNLLFLLSRSNLSILPLMRSLPLLSVWLHPPYLSFLLLFGSLPESSHLTLFLLPNQPTSFEFKSKFVKKISGKRLNLANKAGLKKNDMNCKISILFTKFHLCTVCQLCSENVDFNLKIPMYSQIGNLSKKFNLFFFLFLMTLSIS